MCLKEEKNFLEIFIQKVVSLWIQLNFFLVLIKAFPLFFPLEKNDFDLFLY